MKGVNRMMARTDHEVEFSVSYDGDALTQNTMDVRDLAPALLALGQSFERANSLCNGDRASVSLRIRATKPGSFEIVLSLQQLLEEATEFLSGDMMVSVFVLKELLIGGRGQGVIGLLQLLKQLHGKKPQQTEATPDGITFEADNIKLYIPTEVARLYNDRPTRDNMEAVIRPLLKRGIDSVVFKENNEEIESIQKQEAEYFNSGDYDSDNIVEHVIPRQRLQIASLAFDKDGKWRLSDGANTHWYSMDDQNFLKEIQQGKRFGKDDILICEVLLVQNIDVTGKLKLEYAVKQVLSHIPPAKQPSLLNNNTSTSE